MSVWNKLVAALLLMRRSWIIALVLMAVLAVILLIFCRGFTWRSRRMGVYGLLVNLPDRDIWRLTFSLTRFCYAAGVAFSLSELTLPHYMMLLLLCLPFDLIRFSPLRLLFSLISGALLGAALFAGDMLYAYMREVRPEPGIFVIYLLLALFCTLYAAYLTTRDIRQLAWERAEKGEKTHAENENA